MRRDYPINGSPMEEDKLIIVGGAPRSGTTLVQNMLSAHPDVLGGPEALHLHDILEVRKRMLASLARGWLDFYCDKQTIDTCFRWTIMKVLTPLEACRDGAISARRRRRTCWRSRISPSFCRKRALSMSCAIHGES